MDSSTRSKAYREPLMPMAFSVGEAASRMGVSSDKVRELVRANVIPHKRIGRRIIIPRVAFERWLNEADSWKSYEEESGDGKS